MKVGTWGKDAKQIHEFYPINQFNCAPDSLKITVGECVLTETHMTGKCSATTEEVKKHPEWMCDAGEMTWDIQLVTHYCTRFCNKHFCKWKESDFHIL